MHLNISGNEKEVEYRPLMCLHDVEYRPLMCLM